MNARKESINDDAAWELLSDCNQISIAKGKKIKEYTPDSALKDAILKDAMGRSGNLRAPTIITGTSCYIGFNQDMYDGLTKSNS